MKTLRTLLLACLPLLFAAGASAQSPSLIIDQAWVRSVPGSDVAAVYFVLRNTTPEPVIVVAVRSPLARHSMVHQTAVEDGQSRMRPRDSVVIAPGETVEFEPGGLHVMLHGLKSQVRTGQSVPLVLLLASGGEVTVAAKVRPLSAQ